MNRSCPAIATLAGLVFVACADRAPVKPDASGPKTGAVRIETTPTGAAVLIGGRERVGHAPLTLERPIGSRVDLLLVKDGHLPERRSVVIEGRGPQQLRVIFRPNRGLIVVRSGAVRGATVLVDGVDRGRTPTKVWVEVGRHDLRVEKRGLHPYQREIVVERDGVQNIQALIVPVVKGAKLGFLSVATDVPAAATLNGAPVGMTPLAKLPIPAKRHVLRLESKEPPATRRLTIRIAAGEHKKLSVKLRR